MPKIIKCKFNIFQEGRKYTGHHRQYVLENAKNICYSPATREGISLREKYGFFGHGRRQTAGKIRIEEIETIKTPNGTLIVENVPSNVTTFFEILGDGTVEHHQEILESAPGNIIQSLHNSKVGGFSWACGGSDAGRRGATLLTSFEGFDYVLTPGFVENRGYVLESADTATTDMILESICQTTGIDDKSAEAILRNWTASAQYKAFELEETLRGAEAYEADMAETMDRLKTEVDQVNEKVLIYESAHIARAQAVKSALDKHYIAIPTDVADAMISMASETDFEKVVGFFESAYTAEMRMMPLPKKIKDKVLTAKRQPIDDNAPRGYDLDFKKQFRN